MDELLAALDALGAEDLAPLCGPALLDRLGPLLVAQNRLAAEVARTVRECEVSGAAEVDGLKSMASWLRGHGHLSTAEAARVVRAARALAHLPVMAEAFAAGDVTGERAGLIGQVAEPKALALAAEHGVDLGAVDTVLNGVARAAPCADVAKAVHHYLDRLDAHGPEPDPTEGRRLVLATHADGSVSGRFDLDAVGGEKLQTALESLVQAGRGAADERTRAQQQADALVQLCDNALTAGGLPILRGHKPQVIVKIDLEDLADPRSAAGPPTWASAPRSPPPAPAGWPATDRSPASSWAPTGCRWTTAAPCGCSRRTSGAPRRSATAAACSPGVARRRGGATCTTCWPGSTAAPPIWTTPRCCASGTLTLCAPRLPGRTTTEWPVAHLAARRHRDLIGPQHTGPPLATAA
ncbi:DUF222 domain-containing protein [Geodermatophilus sp. URMC 65]